MTTKSHIAEGKKTRCSLKVRRYKTGRVIPRRLVKERPSCDGCQRKRPVARTVSLPGTKRWTGKKWA